MIRFHCPKCGHDTAEEVLMDAVVYTEVTGISEECIDLTYGDYEINDGHVSYYQCAKCGWAVPGVDNADDMYAWIKKNGKETGDEN